MPNAFHLPLLNAPRSGAHVFSWIPKLDKPYICCTHSRLRNSRTVFLGNGLDLRKFCARAERFERRIGARRSQEGINVQIFASEIPDQEEAVFQLLTSPNARVRLDGLKDIEQLKPENQITLIERVLKAGDPIIRSKVMYALVNLAPQYQDAVKVVLRVLEGDSDYGVRAAAAGALGYIQDDIAVDSLIRVVMEETNWIVKHSAVVALGNIRNARAAPLLLQLLKQQSIEDDSGILMQQALISALGEVGALEAVDEIVRFVGSADDVTRLLVAEALAGLPSKQSLSALKFLEKDPSPLVQGSAVPALAKVEAALAEQGK
mmetsp:Transcript_5415/g.8896  ORF Transcript_5415/g.8896 Transcript_5415/m.8896 type:complete len:319 (-) Transcript_5415:241-1197(-)|eukprot:CAMPEP_0184643620 /NCGR_PEP_ID=MMETSP0308-20130426/449_1 /TAXON_ID=38269 /ORGANISM="Gloeochaete witrockiana, Strain SAG 46.84" /LENGTH=318 /DNA_ID=CAMNT_0027071665 /DNA_START=83 /DNA_END=1039 /DNA_ORIENTATION=+